MRCLAVLIALLTAACSHGDNSSNPSTSSSNSLGQTSVTIPINPGAVALGAQAYGDNPLVINVGTAVTWVNRDTMQHTATSDTGVWDTGVILPNGAFSYTFNVSGTYPYHCKIHGAQAMSGVITVH